MHPVPCDYRGERANAGISTRIESMEHPFFHVSFAPNIKLVSTVRRFTAEFYERVLVDQEVSEEGGACDA